MRASLRTLGLVGALATGLAAGAAAPRAAEPRELNLRVGQRQAVGAGVTLRFVRVTRDDRCPADARCITAGEAVIRLSVREGRGAEQPVTLRTTEAGAVATVGAMQVRLVTLAPEPLSTKTLRQGDYRLTLRVSTP